MYSTLVWCCILLASGVFGVMLYSVATHRGSAGAASGRYRRRLLLELLWAAVPIAIIVMAAMPALRELTVTAPAIVATTQE